MDSKKYSKEYYETHKEQIKEIHKKYYETHKEEIKKTKKKYRETHKEEIKEKNKIWCDLDCLNCRYPKCELYE